MVGDGTGEGIGVAIGEGDMVAVGDSTPGADVAVPLTGGGLTARQRC